MFLEKSYRGNNKWYFYILTLIIVFAAVQVASIPLVIYSIIMNPEILSGGTNNILAVTNTNLGLALMLFTVPVKKDKCSNINSLDVDCILFYIIAQ